MAPQRGRPARPGSQGDHGDSPDDASSGQGSQGSQRLTEVARRWERRGYRVRYQDPYLVQLVTNRWLWGYGLPLYLAAALTLAMTIVLVVVGLRRSRPSVVSLTTTPEGEVFAVKRPLARHSED